MDQRVVSEPGKNLTEPRKARGPARLDFFESWQQRGLVPVQLRRDLLLTHETSTQTQFDLRAGGSDDAQIRLLP